ncbi:MAG: FitA-like ribbon-helix-helix domain-containing protein, partial [Actinomycetota bacterium]
AAKPALPRGVPAENHLDTPDIKSISFCIMRSLQVRNIPDDLYEALRATAGREGRSLSAQAVAILRGALADSLVDRAGVARRVAERRRSAGVMTRRAEQLVREDRDR